MKKQNECTHREFYSQFVTDSMKQSISAYFGIEKLKKAFEENKHFNSLKLESWDSLAFSCCQHNYTVKEALKEAKHSYSLSTGVCIMKEAAKQIIEEN